jgi:hypothetical protein
MCGNPMAYLNHEDNRHTPKPTEKACGFFSDKEPKWKRSQPTPETEISYLSDPQSENQNATNL